MKKSDFIYFKDLEGNIFESSFTYTKFVCAYGKYWGGRGGRETVKFHQFSLLYSIKKVLIHKLSRQIN